MICDECKKNFSPNKLFVRAKGFILPDNGRPAWCRECYIKLHGIDVAEIYS